MNESLGTPWECARAPLDSSANRSSVEANATCSNASLFTKLHATRSKGELLCFGRILEKERKKKSLVFVFARCPDAQCVSSECSECRTHSFQAATRKLLQSLKLLWSYLKASFFGKLLTGLGFCFWRNSAVKGLPTFPRTINQPVKHWETSYSPKCVCVQAKRWRLLPAMSTSLGWVENGLQLWTAWIHFLVCLLLLNLFRLSVVF